MKSIILTEGGEKIGFGHISRCYALKQAFEGKDISVRFVIDGDTSIKNMLREINYELKNWVIDDSWKEKADIIVVDSYHAPYSFYEDVSCIADVPVYLDDYVRMDYPRGIIMNGSFLAEKLPYKRNNHNEYLLGGQYAILQKEFQKPFSKNITKQINNILVTFGGNDLSNLTPVIIKFLVHNYPYMQKSVLIGDGFQNIEEIKKVYDDSVELIYYPKAQEIRNQMERADIAISAAGQTLYELAHMGVPTIAIQVVDNQANNVRGLVEKKAVEYAGIYKDKELLKELDILFKSLHDQDKRRNLSRVSSQLVDGKGVYRIVNAIIEKIKAKSWINS